tara:strand:+ start:1516 stop:1884 length:369 start_codon:yes stop_codon:yes gene_type:complete
MIGKCINCQTEIIGPTHMLYCSRNCSRRYRRKHGAVHRKPVITTENCEQCGNEFTKKNKTNTFCSRRCRWDSQKVDPIYLNCEMCGKEFLKKRKGHHLCSLQCVGKKRKRTNETKTKTTNLA